MSTFGKRNANAIKRYQACVAQGKIQPCHWQSLKNQIYLGDVLFVVQMQQPLTDNALLDDIPILQSNLLPSRWPITQANTKTVIKRSWRPITAAITSEANCGLLQAALVACQQDH